MAYVLTAVVHPSATSVAAPPSALHQTTQPLSRQSVVSITRIVHDDAEVVADVVGQLGKWTESYDTHAANRQKLIGDLEQALAVITNRIDGWDALTTNQKQAQILNDWPRLLSYLRKDVRITTGLLSVAE